MISPRAWTGAVLIGLGSAISGGFALSQLPGCESINKIVEHSESRYLPLGWKDIELGMSMQDVQKVRPLITGTGKEGRVKEDLEKTAIQEFGRWLFGGDTRGDYEHVSGAGLTPEQYEKLIVNGGYTAPLAESEMQPFRHAKVIYRFETEKLSEVDFIFQVEGNDCIYTDPHFFRVFRDYAEKRLGPGKQEGRSFTVTQGNLRASLHLEGNVWACAMHYLLARPEKEE